MMLFTAGGMDYNKVSWKRRKEKTSKRWEETRLQQNQEILLITEEQQSKAEWSEAIPLPSKHSCLISHLSSPSN